MSNLKDLDIARFVQAKLANQMAEFIQYDWSDNFKKERTKDLTEKIKSTKGYFDINIENLSKDEALSLGFQQWDDEGLMLIPLYLKDFLSDFKGSSISGGGKRLIKATDMDNDHRFGAMAYGYYPSK